MEPQFWRDRWEEGRIGFHKDVVHPHLVAHLPRLGLTPGARVFVPLCGKTLDIGWLASQGYRVVGAELSEIAVRELFEGLGVEAEVVSAGPLALWRWAGVEIFVGDLFDLDAARLGPVDAIYDRAALVALPEAMRARYAEALVEMTGSAPQLAITFEYDQTKMAGPPFSVTPEEVQRLYGGVYALEVAWRGAVPGGLKGGVVEAEETVWVMR